MEPPPEKHQSGRFIFPSERDRLFIRLSREMVMDRVKIRSDAKSNHGCKMSGWKSNLYQRCCLLALWCRVLKRVNIALFATKKRNFRQLPNAALCVERECCNFVYAF